MSTHSKQSLDSQDSENFNPRPILDSDHESIERTQSGHSSKSWRLRRNTTNMSELSKIISGFRDDREMDMLDYQSEKNMPMAEELLSKQLSINQNKLEEQKSEVLLDVERATSHVEDDDYPIDGKFAFWQAFLVMLMVFSTWGANAAFGVFLNFYLNSDAFPGASPYDFALMGGIVIFLAQGLAPFSALAVRLFGQVPVFIVGIILQTVGYFLAAECTKLWQIFICQGVLVGISFSFIFIPGTLVLPTWFNKYKALAMGIAVSGAGLGGLVYSLVLNKIMQETGNQRWPLRTVGIANFAISAFGCFFNRARNGKKPDLKLTMNWQYFKTSLQIILDFKVFTLYPLLIVGVWFGLVLLGYVIILYSLAAYGTSIGLTHTQGSNVLAFLNAMQVLGRPSIGILGDIIGRSNTATLFCIYMGIMTTAFWLNVDNYGKMIAIAFLVGGPAGIGSTLSQSLALDILAHVQKSDKISAVWGGLNIIVAMFSLPAEVIALKLRKGTGPKSYQNAQIFTGCCFFASVLLLLVNREWLVRQTFKARKAVTQELIEGKESDVNEQHTEEREGIEEKRDGAGNERSDGNEKDQRETVDIETLERRLERYDFLLQPNIMSYVVRMFYPIRV